MMHLTDEQHVGRLNPGPPKADIAAEKSRRMESMKISPQSCHSFTLSLSPVYPVHSSGVYSSGMFSSGSSYR